MPIPRIPAPSNAIEAGSSTVACAITVPEKEVAPSPCAVMVMIPGVASKPVRCRVPDPDSTTVPSWFCVGCNAELMNVKRSKVAVKAP